MKVAAIVPSYNPDGNLPAVVQGLVDAGFGRIYLVDDGSDEAHRPCIEEAAGLPGVTLLRHEANRGKGRALKTAMGHYLSEADSYVGVVTLDGDGQHRTEDVVKVAEALAQTPDNLVLGARDFSQDNVPKRSAFGNKVTRTVFRLACGIPITDTQTGLRGIPNAFTETLLTVGGERYEFETNMLLETKRMQVPVREVPITTVYIENNASSHFRPLVDSLRIYLLILKFAFSSLASSLLDLGLFALLNGVLLQLPAAQSFFEALQPALGMVPADQQLFLATVAARICSALFNFFVNRSLVFGSKAHTGGALLRYALLCVVQMLCSYGGTWLLSNLLPLPALLAKIITDTLLFFASFNIQKRWVFNTRPNTGR